MIRRALWAVAVSAVVLAGLAAVPANAAGWPTRLVRILSPFTASGTADTWGRIMVQKLSDTFHQEFVPENKPGASGMIAAGEIVKAAPGQVHAFRVGGPVIATALTPNPPADALTRLTHSARR